MPAIEKRTNYKRRLLGCLLKGCVGRTDFLTVYKYPLFYANITHRPSEVQPETFLG